MTGNYATAINALYNLYRKPFAPEIMEQISVQLALVSASLFNFLPHVPVTEHENIYRNILLHQQLSIIDEVMPEDAMQHTTIKNESGYDLSLFKHDPAIFCTIHLGSYRLVNYFLKQNHISFALVANKNIMLKESSRFKKNFEMFNMENSHPFQIIDAEEPTSAIKMIRALKRGTSLLIYVDGNTGAGTSTNHNMCDIDFLAQQLSVRSGIAYLSLKTKTPVVPVVSCRTDMYTNELHFLPSIISSLGVDEEKTVLQNTMQRLYNQMSQAVIKYPQQWEAWLYLHKSAKTTPYTCDNMNRWGNDIRQVTFNSIEFAIFKISKRSFLLHKNTYSSCLIDESLFDFLSSCLPFHVSDITIASGLINALFDKRILVPADSNICSSLK